MVSALGERWVKRRRAFIQKTGRIPATALSEPEAIGTTSWVSLLTVRRKPSAAPARSRALWDTR